MANDARSFNLVDEPWVRVRTLEGATDELSLLDVFRHAHEIERLANDLPTQDFAILRVLIAVLQRSVVGRLGGDEYPSDVWGQLWSAETLPVKDVERYLDAWHHRFDLLDADEPFMQVANLEAQNGKTKDIRVLMGISENKPQLFPTRALKGMNDLSLAEATRWLIHAHAYDVAGIKTGVVGDPAAKAGKSSPRGTGWAGNLGGCYLEGGTLAETMLLNLVLCDDCYDNPDSPVAIDDLPVWEREQKVPGDEGRPAAGHADVYTWQSRRVRLVVDEGRVIGAVLTNGDKLEVYNKKDIEPMTAWRRSPNMEKRLRTVPVYRPNGHHSDRALWRGLTSILPQTEADEETFVAPGVVVWAGFLSDMNGGEHLRQDYPLRVHAVGLEYGTQSSVAIEQIDDVLALNAFLFSAAGRQASVMAKRCMENTDKAVGQVLARLQRRLRLAAGEDGLVVDQALQAVRAEAFFELDGAFRSWLAQLGPETDCAAAEDAWNRQASEILGTIARRLVEEAGQDAVVGRLVKVGKKEEWVSAGRAELQFWYWLGKTLPHDGGTSGQEKGEG